MLELKKGGRLMNIFLLSLGGALGAISRYLVGLGMVKRFPHPPIPLAMLSVNLLGSLGLGIFLSLYFQSIPVDAYKDPIFLIVGLGFFGAFTTFSTFSMEALDLFQRKLYAKALIYISASIMGSIIAFTIGFVTFIR